MSWAQYFTDISDVYCINLLKKLPINNCNIGIRYGLNVIDNTPMYGMESHWLLCFGAWKHFLSLGCEYGHYVIGDQLDWRSRDKASMTNCQRPQPEYKKCSTTCLVNPQQCLLRLSYWKKILIGFLFSLFR